MKDNILRPKSFFVLCYLTVSLFIIQGCHKCDGSLGIDQAQINSIAQYKEERNNLLKSIHPAIAQLNPQEKKVSERFELLKQEIYNKNHPARPWISKPFYEVKDQIAETQLYKVIQQMPKGSILHLHPFAMGDINAVIDKAMTREDAYVVAEGSHRGMIRFKKAKNSVPVSSMSFHGLNKTDLLKCVTIGPEDESIEDIWPEFENIFARMSGPIFNYPYEEYCYQAIEYFATKDNISHVELRVQTPQKETVEMYKRILDRLESNGIEISICLIYSDTRQPQRKETATDRCKKLQGSLSKAVDLIEQYPEILRGVDIYSEEDKGLPASLMAELIIEAKNKALAKGIELNLYLHGGESIFPISFNATDEFDNNIPKYYNNNVIDVYLLGAKRVGHGFELAKLPGLAEYYRKSGICVELCPISNQLLRYFKDLRNHPGITLFNQGVPITISPDDPAIFGYQGVSFDYWVAVMAWDLSLADVKKCIVNSIEYSSLNPTEKSELMKKWQKQWTKFIDEMIAKNGVWFPSSGRN